MKRLPSFLPGTYLWLSDWMTGLLVGFLTVNGLDENDS